MVVVEARKKIGIEVRQRILKMENCGKDKEKDEDEAGN